jgi:acetyl esterase
VTEPLDLEVAALAMASKAAGLPPITSIDPAEARRRTTRADALVAPGPSLARVADLDALGVPIRLYSPSQQPLDRIVMYVHGGGWVTGDLETLDGFCRTVAAACHAVVVSVDYRLAPDHQYPAGLDDVATVWSWIALTEAGGHVVAGAHAGLMGDSSGGNLAAVLAARADPRPAFQALLYPVVDHDLERPSYTEHAAAFPLTSAAMAWFWDHYVPADARADAAVSPLRSATLSSLPPTLVVVAGHDPLRDEGLAYAAALRRAGVTVELIDQPSLPHSFLRLTGVSSGARDAQDAIVEALRGLWSRNFAPTSRSEPHDG